MKKVINLLVILLLVIFMTSCNKNAESNSNYNGSKLLIEEKTEYTISEYLNSGQRLILYHINYSVPEDEINKEKIYFENAKIDIIYIFSDGLLDIFSGRDARSGEYITIEEVSKKTDDEVVNRCKTLNTYARYLDYKIKVCPYSGENVTQYDEKIEFEDINVGLYWWNPYSSVNIVRFDASDYSNDKLSVNSSVFLNLSRHMSMWDESYDITSFLYRPDGYTLSLDTPDSEGVIVDP